MLSVLADVSGLMARGLEMVWDTNKERMIRIGQILNIVNNKWGSKNPFGKFLTVSLFQGERRRC